MSLDAMTIAWHGDKDRDELLEAIDRIYTTDRPALSRIYGLIEEARNVLPDCVHPAFSPEHSTRIGRAQLLLDAALGEPDAVLGLQQLREREAK